MERQPIGAYYAPILKMCLVFLIISSLFGILAKNFYVFIAFAFLFFCIGVGEAIYLKLDYNNYRYSISQEKVTIERGIFSKDTIATLFNLVKDVNVNEPILLRAFGLAKIQFSDSLGYLEIVLSKEDAISLQNMITAKMSVNRVGIMDQKTG